MKCQHCQSEVSDNKTICPHCGRPLGRDISIQKQNEWSKSIENTDKIYAVICLFTAGIAIFFIPPLFGGLGIWLSTLVMKKNKPLGSGLLLLNMVCLIIGIIYGMISYLS